VCVCVERGAWNSQGHKVDQSFHVVLRLRMRRVLPPLPHMPSSCAQISFYLYFVSKFWQPEKLIYLYMFEF